MRPTAMTADDRSRRTRVYALAAAMITTALLTETLGRDLLFTAVFIIGCARAFEMPTAHALVPTLVPSP